jgi:hypothetical protein
MGRLEDAEGCRERKAAEGEGEGLARVARRRLRVLTVRRAGKTGCGELW